VRRNGGKRPAAAPSVGDSRQGDGFLRPSRTALPGTSRKIVICDCGSWRLPRFQFERRAVIPGLAQVLKALPADLLPLDVVDWFALPDADLQLESDVAPLSPREWLLSGRPVEKVVNLARDLTRRAPQRRGASGDRPTNSCSTFPTVCYCTENKGTPTTAPAANQHYWQSRAS
jgi:hypothetical protein